MKTKVFSLFLFWKNRIEFFICFFILLHNIALTAQSKFSLSIIGQERRDKYLDIIAAVNNLADQQDSFKLASFLVDNKGNKHYMEPFDLPWNSPDGSTHIVNPEGLIIQTYPYLLFKLPSKDSTLVPIVFRLSFKISSTVKPVRIHLFKGGPEANLKEVPFFPTMKKPVIEVGKHSSDLSITVQKIARTRENPSVDGSLPGLLEALRSLDTSFVTRATLNFFTHFVIVTGNVWLALDLTINNKSEIAKKISFDEIILLPKGKGQDIMRYKPIGDAKDGIITLDSSFTKSIILNANTKNSLILVFNPEIWQDEFTLSFHISELGSDLKDDIISKDDPEMILISKGAYVLNYAEEGSIFNSFGGDYNVSKDFYLDKYEVSNSQYKRFIEATSHQPPAYWTGVNYPSGQGNRPVLVNFSDADAYSKWAGKRLMTFPEWVAAMSNPNTNSSPWIGTLSLDKISKKGLNIFKLKESVTELIDFIDGVGTNLIDKSPSGIYDLMGNAIEWTCSPNMSDLEKRNLIHIQMAGFFVYNNFAVTLLQAGPDPKIYFGFRCAKDIDNEIAERDDNFISNTFIDPRDGKEYLTVKIGEQVWMAENLNYDAGSGSWCFNDKVSNCEKCGRLYNWETALKAPPPGWHLPSFDEWENLIDYCGAEGLDAYNQLITGGTSLFNATLCDYHIDAGKMSFNVTGGYFWSAAEYDDENAWKCNVDSYTQEVYLKEGSKETGFSVRCVKD